MSADPDYAIDDLRGQEEARENADGLAYEEWWDEHAPASEPYAWDEPPTVASS